MAATRDQIVNTMSRGTAMDSDQAAFVTDGLIAMGGGGSVSSVFSRTGDVTAQLNDYQASLVQNDSGIAGSTVADALDNLQASEPSTVVTGSLVFVASVWQTFYSLPLAEGEFYAISVPYCSFYRGVAADVQVANFRFLNVCRRVTGFSAQVGGGNLQAQGFVGGSFRAIASGNNVDFQAQFNVGDTFNFVVPIFLEGGSL